MAGVVKLGEALVQAGLIDDFQLKSALGQQRKWGGRIGKALIDLGFIDEGTLIKFLSEKLKFSAVDLSRSKIAEKTYSAVPKRVAEKYMSIPVVIRDTPGKRTLVLAMADPTDLKAIDEIEFLTNLKIEPVVALESAILNVLKHYGQEGPPMPEDDPNSISLVDTGPPASIETGHGEAQQIIEPQPALPIEEVPPGLLPTPPPPEPGAAVQGEAEFDFSKYSQAEIEAQEARDRGQAQPISEDDAPLEMVSTDGAVEESEVIEEAETLEDTKPPIITLPPAPPPATHRAVPLPEVPLDPTNFLPPETVGDVEDFFATPAQPEVAQAQAHEDIVESAEAIEDAEEITAPPEIINEAESVIDPISEMAEAVAVAEPLHEEEGEIAEAEPVHDDTAIAEAVEATPEGVVPPMGGIEEPHSAVDAFWATEPILDESPEAVEMMAEAVTEEQVLEATPNEEQVAEAIPHYEPVSEAIPEDELAAPAIEEPQAWTEQLAETPAPYTGQPVEQIAEAVPAEPDPASDLEHQVRAIHSEIWELKQKIENFITLFALKEQGKISLEEFLEELRK